MTCRDDLHNPYRKHAASSLQSPLLYRTMLSVATEFMYAHGRIPASLNLRRQNEAIVCLRQAVESLSAAASERSENDLTLRQNVLASVLLQIMNVLFTGGRGADNHIRGARSLARDLGYLRHEVHDLHVRSLVQNLVIADISSAAFHRRRPLLPLSMWFLLPNSLLDSTEPSFLKMTGCPQPILCVIARILHLAADRAEEEERRQIRRGTEEKGSEGDGSDMDIRAPIWRSASKIESDLHQYSADSVASYVNKTVGQPDTHVAQVAQGFVWCAYLLLQRRVFNDPTRSWRVQQTMAGLFEAIGKVPVGCGPDSSLHLPFYIGAREAVRAEDRVWVRARYEKLLRHYANPPHRTMMSLVEELWDRHDAYGGLGRWNAELDREIELVERKSDAFIF